MLQKEENRSYQELMIKTTAAKEQLERQVQCTVSPQFYESLIDIDKKMKEYVIIIANVIVNDK